MLYDSYVETVMKFIPYMVLEVAHYKQVVVSWIAQALCFYSDKMKTEQSSSQGQIQDFLGEGASQAEMTD